jgi:Right handed beta helix region
MKTYARLVLCGLLLLGLVACEKDNAVNPDAPGMACAVDTDCTSGVCNVATAECVACLPDNDQACTGPTPVCGGTTCRGCQAHSECDSDACLPDGTCAAETAVIYLRQGGSGVGRGNNCLKGEPCGRLETAIGLASAARPYIRVTGTIENTNEDVMGKTVTFLGSANSALRGDQGGGRGDEPILDVRGASMVTIYDVTVRDGRRAGIRVDEGSAVTLHRSKILSSAEEGILITNGTAVVSQSEIAKSGTMMPRRGIKLDNGEVTIVRSKIWDNGGGGVLIADSQKFTIVNSFIVENRVSGGISAIKPGLGSRLEFNTIADNQDATGGGASDAAGVYCDDDAFTFSNNIVYRNIGGAQGFAQIGGICKFDGSYLSPSNMADPRVMGFVNDISPRDYHLTAASPGIVRDVAPCTAAEDFVDYDGDLRPVGGACELGADEIK